MRPVPHLSLALRERHLVTFVITVSMTVGNAGGQIFIGGVGGDGQEAPTSIDDVVMYAVDDQSDELVRHKFGDAEPLVIGVLSYEGGPIASTVECLGYVPSGPDKGLYGVDNFDGSTAARLVKINVLDATVHPVAPDLGFGNVEGMVPVWEPAEQRWMLYATQSGGEDGGPDGGDGDLQLDWWVNGVHAGTIEPDGAFADPVWYYSGDAIDPLGVQLGYAVAVNPGGMISGNVTLENTSPAPAEVVVQLSFPLAQPFTGQTELIGSAAIGLTTDAGGGTLATAYGAPVWQGLIDGVAAASLFPAPFEMHNDGLGSIGENANLGIPTPLNGPAAMQTAGIRIVMSLTPLDQASTTNVFHISGDNEEPPSGNQLLRIDPATGLGQPVMPLSHRFEGLARGPDSDTLYAAKGHQLWAINVAAQTASLIGQHSFPQVLALEFALGDGEPQIDVPGVPDDWTGGGVLFGFSAAQNTMVIMNPASGQAVAYDAPLSASGLEGIVFLTQQSDPFGVIVASAGD